MPSSTYLGRKPSTDTRITAKLIDKIKCFIASGEVIPGGKFPPERELAKAFHVNRASFCGRLSRFWRLWRTHAARG